MTPDDFLSEELDPQPATLEAWEAREREARAREAARIRNARDALIRGFSPALLGLTGPVPGLLVGGTPPLVPERVWGGSLGWPSRKRLARWRELLGRGGHLTEEPSRGVLLRCQFDAAALLPHPIMPPEFAVRQISYFEVDKQARTQEFVRLQRWQADNDAVLQAHVEWQLTGLDVVVVRATGRDRGLPREVPAGLRRHAFAGCKLARRDAQRGIRRLQAGTARTHATAMSDTLS